MQKLIIAIVVLLFIFVGDGYSNTLLVGEESDIFAETDRYQVRFKKGVIMKEKNVVQIGLRTSAEYRFLATLDAREGRERYLPIELTSDRRSVWQYHGVEGNTEYKEYHKNTERETYHFHAISDVDGSTEIDDGSGKMIDVPSMTLETFFDKVGITFCDFLVVDVEGMEWQIFSAYSGRVPIEHVIIEFHYKRVHEEPAYTEDAFKNLLESKGFKILCRHFTNRGGTQEWFLKGHV